MTLIKLAKASDVTLHKATVTLTDAQIKSWPSAPNGYTVVLPAPPDGSYVESLEATIYVNTIGSLGASDPTYSNVDTDARINISDGIGGMASLFSGNGQGSPHDLFEARAGRTVAVFLLRAPIVTGISVAYSFVLDVSDDRRLAVQFDNGSSGNLLGGDIANFATIDVTYQLKQFPA